MPLLDLADGVTVHQVPTRSLGDHSYVIVTGATGAVIDPQRDFERFAVLLADAGAEPAGVLETHIHNDYVSGGSLLAAGYGCPYLLPADSGATLPHREMGDGDSVPLAEGWSLRAIATPGHTPHHISFVLVAPTGPVAVFTGGSMLVGTVGRTDLLGAELTDRLTRDQFRSVRRLATDLDDPVAVAPTHGAGSFCASGPSGESTSTIGRERDRNPALTTDDEDAFVARQTTNLMLYPSYYEHMAPINRGGAERIAPPPPPIDPDALAATDARVIDIRRTADFAAGHVPGSISIPFSPTAATYAAWAGPWNSPTVLVGGDPARVEAMRVDLARIGYDAVVGVVTDGLEAWRSEGRDLATTRLAGFDEMAAESPEAILDVRDPAESEAWIPGAQRLHVAAVSADRVEGDGPVWVHCATGYRTMIAVSKLQAGGREAVAVVSPWREWDGPTQSA
jgi:glyoxylase-like metal-dependent hydrolase (beta-lactamase superfamily II)/rhodanese-related sulfurtransferase